MKKILKKGISIILAVMMAFSFCSVASAADASRVLSFEVSTDGYAVVTDCNVKAKGVVEIPSAVTINENVYKVRYIGDKAFDNCTLITDIKIPEGVTAIRNFAFRNCTSLENVYIPESLAICQFDAFDGCGKMTIHCYEANYQFFSIYSVASDIEVIVIDEDSAEEEDEPVVEEVDFITRFINALKKMIEDIIASFKGDDSDDLSDIPFLEDLPFLDDLPFDI